MRYYLLTQTANKPFVKVSLIANSLKELTNKGFTIDINNKDINLKFNPLIVDENNLPLYKEGVCLKSISKGVIIDTPVDKIPNLSNSILNNEIASIDEATKKEIDKGFVFESKKFSLSKSAQINWLSYFVLNQAGTFTDTEISTINNETYLLTAAKVNSFFEASRNKIETALQTGRTSKNNLTTI